MILLDDSKPLIVLGDTHSVASTIKAVGIIHRKIKGANIVLLGDTGFTFSETRIPHQLQHLEEIWTKYNSHVYAIRGNHDRRLFFDRGLSNSRVTLLPDYSVLGYRGNSILAVGGSISVDRAARLAEPWDYDYDPLEATVQWENREHQHHDIVLAHDVPESLFDYGSVEFAPYSKFIDEDRDLSRDCARNRRVMTDILNLATPRLWFAGHYHRSYATQLDSCAFRILAPSELYTIHNHELK